MTRTPIVRAHPWVLWTVLFVLVVGGFLSYGIGGAAVIVLAVLLVDWVVKVVAFGVEDEPRPASRSRRRGVEVLGASVALAAAGGLIGLVAWII